MSAVAPSVDHQVFVPPVAARSAGSAPEPLEGAPHSGLWRRLRASRPSGAWLLIGLVTTLLAFGGGLLTGRALVPAKAPRVAEGQPEKPEKKSATTPEQPKPAGQPENAAPAVAARQAPGSGTKSAFNSKVAKSAVDRAAARTKGCRNSRDPAGSVATTVTFAQSGKVSDVAITTQRYVGTKTAACIESRLREARVPEFSGGPMTVKKTVTVR
jgi:hypothetical protein